jgi:hypothetical protein
VNNLDTSWGETAAILTHFNRHKDTEELTDFAEQFASRLSEMKVHPVMAHLPEFRELLTTNLQNGSILCVRNMDGRQSTAILTPKDIN